MLRCKADRRTLGNYALIYLLRGRGTFTDATGFNRKLVPGDFFLVFLDIPHWLAHASRLLESEIGSPRKVVRTLGMSCDNFS